MKHTPKPDGSRWMMRNGVDISGPLGAGERDASIAVLTDGKHFWRGDGTWIHAAGNHPLDLLYPVTVTPLPDPEPEEPKPPKELWVNVYRVEQWLNATLNERLADQMARDPRNRLTGHAICYVLLDEAERGFSEEEIEVGSRAYLFSLDPDALSDGDLDFQLARRRKHIAAALSAISQHRSKKPS